MPIPLARQGQESFHLQPAQHGGSPTGQAIPSMECFQGLPDDMPLRNDYVRVMQHTE